MNLNMSYCASLETRQSNFITVPAVRKSESSDMEADELDLPALVVFIQYLPSFAIHSEGYLLSSLKFITPFILLSAAFTPPETTYTVTLPENPESCVFTVINAVPFPLGITFPSASTSAILVSELSYKSV